MSVTALPSTFEAYGWFGLVAIGYVILCWRFIAGASERPHPQRRNQYQGSDLDLWLDGQNDNTWPLEQQRANELPLVAGRDVRRSA